MGRNILLITTDQMRFDALGCNGGIVARTPVIDALAAAGHMQGLEKELAMKLAKMTVLGGAKLAADPSAVPEVLRVNVTSPNGTTEAGLKILMNSENGLGPLIEKTVAAATARSEELANG